MPARLRICVALAVVGLAGAFVVEPAIASRRDWVGSPACGACHPAELAAWQATAHARTRARFPSRPEGRCLGCHATGESPAGPAIAVEVGCEACHGAGAAYATDDLMRDRPVALALGLADISTADARAAICARCHRRSTRSTPPDLRAPVHPTVAPTTSGAR
jgi:Cytochrome c554 and c-prime